MGLFGKKNDAGGGDDPNRSALFGNRSKAHPPAAASTNPYAQAPPQSGNPYAQAPPDPYIAAKQKAYGSPDPYPAGGNQNQRGHGGDNRYGGDSKSPAFTGTMAGGGYGANKFANQGGYGSDRYGASGANQNQPAGGSRYGNGGYGGLGGNIYTSRQDDENRSALFGGAEERMQRKQQQNPGGYGGAPPPYDGDNQNAYGGQPGNYGNSGGYGAGSGYNPGPKYEDRQLTAEEEEEEQVNATKQEIRFIKQQDVASTRNALRIAEQAEEVGRDTLARLGMQGKI